MRFAQGACVLAIWSSVLAFTGCHSFDHYYEPLGDCCGTADPVFGGCQQGACQADCGKGCGAAHGVGFKHLLTCQSGCGEIYWGEWLSDPPAPCDPCDDCGNFVGPRCCPPRLGARIAAGAPSLFGYRCAPAGFMGGKSKWGDVGDEIIWSDDTGEVVESAPRQPGSDSSGPPPAPAPAQPRDMAEELNELRPPPPVPPAPDGEASRTRSSHDRRNTAGLHSIIRSHRTAQ